MRCGERIRRNNIKPKFKIHFQNLQEDLGIYITILTTDNYIIDESYPNSSNNFDEHNFDIDIIAPPDDWIHSGYSALPDDWIHSGYSHINNNMISYFNMPIFRTVQINKHKYVWGCQHWHVTINNAMECAKSRAYNLILQDEKLQIKYLKMI